MRTVSTLLSLAGLAAASFVVYDPSDDVGTIAWEADNALLADYTVMPTSYHTLPYKATKIVRHGKHTFTHESFSIDANDSSVFIVTNGATVTLQYDTFLKEGYSSNLIEASFFGINSAIWVGNASTAYIDSVNVTVHNGGANIYSYGSDTVAYVSNAELYSSGPVSHGIYASGNGTVYANNIHHYSGGYRASSFSGDSPGGYIHVTDAVVHTDGHGSATCFALGLCNMTNVIGHNSVSPAMFMDDDQVAIWTECDLTAGLLAGMVMFSSGAQGLGGVVTLDHSKLTVLGEDMAALWFGNTIATANIIASTINNTASGILIVANFSQVTQDFTFFAGYDLQPNLNPAGAIVYVQESSLEGNLVSYNGSYIDFYLQDESSWSGSTEYPYGNATINIYVEATSSFELTKDTTVTKIVNGDTTFKNLKSNGFSLFYDSAAAENSYLGAKTLSLSGGGVVKPL